VSESALWTTSRKILGRRTAICLDARRDYVNEFYKSTKNGGPESRPSEASGKVLRHVSLRCEPGDA
jgi:hypothetical protein